MKKILLALAISAVGAVQSGEAMDLQLMQKAQGLANILIKSDQCSYEIDQDALEKYYSSNGLDTPEVLSFISANVELAEFGNKPTKSDCTLARTTAKSIGILSN